MAGLLWIFTLAGGSPHDVRATEPTRPNILFAFADDWSWPHASVAGDAVVKTPTFDRIANEGVLFTNAFVSAPSCSPSRSAVLTGQHFWRLEAGSILWSTLPAKFAVYPDLLEEAGFHIGYSGKGWGPGDVEKGGRTSNGAGPRYRDFKQFLESQPEGKPFCFWFGSFHPHRHYKWRSGVDSGMRLQDVEVPACFPDCDEVRTDICDYYWKVQQFDLQLKQMIEALEQRGELDKTLVVVSSDNGMPFPRCKSNLYDMGTHVPLAVRWPKKVSGGRVVEDLVSLTDLAPTFLQVAGLSVPAEMTGKSLLNVLFSRESGRVDSSRNRVFSGKERHATLGYPMRAIRTHDFLYVRNFEPRRFGGGDPDGDDPVDPPPHTRNGYGNPYGDIDGSPTKYFMLQHRQEPQVKALFAEAFGRRNAEELYDVRSDPDQRHNLASDPSYADQKRKLAAELLAELQASRDPRAVGQGDVFDSYPYYWQGPKPEVGSKR